MLGVESHDPTYGTSFDVISNNVELGLVTQDLTLHLYANATPEYAAEIIRWWFLAQNDVMHSEDDVMYQVKNGTGTDTWIYSQDD